MRTNASTSAAPANCPMKGMLSAIVAAGPQPATDRIATCRQSTVLRFSWG